MRKTRHRAEGDDAAAARIPARGGGAYRSAKRITGEFDDKRLDMNLFTAYRVSLIGRDGALMAKRRRYRSEVRDRARDDTRDRIIQAVIDVILREGVDAFTMQSVADKARVSLRTVYRHFAAREQLLEGLSDHVSSAMDTFGFRAPTNLAEVEALMRPLYSYFASIQDALRASVVASIAIGYTSRSYRERQVAVHDLLTAAYPNLSADERKEAAAVISTLSGSRAWYVITAELSLDSDQGGRAVEWGIRTLLGDLKKRDKAARRN